MTHRMLTALLTLLPLVVFAFDLELTPNPQLKATEVVEFQLDALRHNQSGEGIEATFRFASPANKSQTGPLPRFTRLFDNPQYSPMLNHISADVELLKSTANAVSVGAVLVDANGSVFWYQFDLSKQYLPDCNGCWMTDAVYRIEEPGNSA